MSNKYFWNIAKAVKIVTNEHEISEYPKAYVVFDNDNKALKNAINWAGANYKVYEFINDGFQLELRQIENVSNSFTGKGNTYWNCLITKNDITFSITINSEMICDLIRNTTFINGKCQSEVMFAQHGKTLGVTTKDMDCYKAVTEYMDIKENFSKNKTSKWEKGCGYVTPTKEDVWICDIHTPLLIDNKVDQNKTVIYNFDTNRVSHYLLDTAEIKKGKGISNIDDYLLSIDIGDFKKNLVDRFPARAKGSTRVDVTSVEEKVAIRLNQLNIESIKNNVNYYDKYGQVSVALMSTDGVINDNMLYSLNRHIENGIYDYPDTKHIVYDGENTEEFESSRDALKYILNKLVDLFNKIKNIE